jgi:hypothetical protein
VPEVREQQGGNRREMVVDGFRFGKQTIRPCDQSTKSVVSWASRNSALPLTPEARIGFPDGRDLGTCILI